MADDLVQRLRRLVPSAGALLGYEALCAEAAARIAELERALRMVKADRPSVHSDDVWLAVCAALDPAVGGAPGVSETHTDPKEAPQ